MPHSFCSFPDGESPRIPASDDLTSYSKLPAVRSFSLLSAAQERGRERATESETEGHCAFQI